MPGFRLGISNDDEGIAPPSQPIYSYTWSLDNLAGSNNGGIGADSPLIYVRDLCLPEFGVDTEEIKASSIKYKYANGITWNDVKVTFYGTGTLLASLEELKRRVWTPEGGIQPAASYKSISTITQYYADDETEAQVWTLNGSWIRTISHSPLTYTNSEVYNVTVAVAYDWATVIVAGLSGGDF